QLQALIDEWIAQCRPRDSVASSAAWTPYAVSLRISAWIAAWTRRGGFGNVQFGHLLASSIREQADYLVANLETDVRGNHLIKNIRALVEASAAFGSSANPRWARVAEDWLAQELDVQILPD